MIRALIILQIFLSGVFYLLIPGLGAFFVRSRWRKFRSGVVAASTYPRITYAGMRTGTTETGDGLFRFLGALEAIQDDDVMWLRNDELSLSADMKGQRVYLLSSAPAGLEEEGGDAGGPARPGEAPAVVPWDKVSSLPEGTKVFVAGPLRMDGGRGVFRSRPGADLLVIFYDGDERSIVRRAVWNGRQRNEYWNPFTPAALAGGILAGTIFAYFFLKNPLYRVPGILSVGTALVPVLPLFPPGVVFFFLYRRLWSRARLLRAERDLVRLPLRHHRGDAADTILTTGEKYGCRVRRGTAEEIRRMGGRVRAASARRPGDRERADYYWFGVVSEDPEDLPGKSRDPFVETVAIPGRPETLASDCEIRAKRLESLAVLLFCAGFGINALLVLRLLARLIR